MVDLACGSARSTLKSATHPITSAQDGRCQARPLAGSAARDPFTSGPTGCGRRGRPRLRTRRKAPAQVRLIEDVRDSTTQAAPPGRPVRRRPDLEHAGRGVPGAHRLQHIAAPRVRPETFASYRDDVRLHISPAVGPHRLDKLAPHHVRAMRTAIIGKGRSSTTALHCHGTLVEGADRRDARGARHPQRRNARRAPHPRSESPRNCPPPTPRPEDAGRRARQPLQQLVQRRGKPDPVSRPALEPPLDTVVRPDHHGERLSPPVVVVYHQDGHEHAWNAPSDTAGDKLGRRVASADPRDRTEVRRGERSPADR